jgi:hypothetical protein
MKTIFKATVAGLNVTASDAGEGQKFFTPENPSVNGRYLVVWDRHNAPGQNKKYFDSRVEAMQFAFFQRDHLRFIEAKDAGLNDEFAELVAVGKMTLEAALGDMDVSAESDEMEYGDGFDPDLHGGEDDNTPPLEIIMAGGQAAWDYQNEKNAWLDSRI